MEIYDNEIMNFEKFKGVFISALQDHYGNLEKVAAGKITKVNQGELTSVRLEKPDMMPMPTLYMEHLYEDYVRCGSFHEVVDKTIRAFAMDIPKESRIKISDVTDPSAVLEKAYCQIIGIKGNEKFLETVPHKRHEDLAFIYRVMAGRDENGILSIVLTNTNTKGLDIPLDTLHEKALANTEKFFPVKIMNLAEMLPIGEVLDNRSDLLMITNEGQSLGAAAAFYPGVLEHISEAMGGSIFLLPSSVHEFMAVADNGNHDVKWLRGMVKEANQCVVKAEDRLTDSVYRFRRGDKALSLCKDENRRSRGRDER